MADNELQRAVFDAVYRSRRQRLLRLAAVFLLGLRHGARGVAFSWPLYALGIAAAWLPAGGRLLLLALLPALAVSGYILVIGVRSDYAAMVAGAILQGRRLGRLLRAGPGDG